MANALYPKAKEQMLQGGINLSSATVKWQLVDTNGGTPYTYSAAHEFLSDVPSGARLAQSAALASKTFASGTFDAADPSLTDSGGGATGEALILFIDTGSAATSRLIAYFDTGVTGLPLTLDGTNDTIQHHASGIFSL